MYERTADRLRQLATDLAVVNNFAFLPHRRAIPAQAGLKGPTVNIGGLDYVVTDQLTLCNCYLSVVTAALGCPVPPMKANDQISRFLDANEGKMNGWTECNRLMAIERAKLGYPTVMGAIAPGHGHIALVMPSPVTDPTGLYVSAAGSSNFVNVPSIKSFAHLDPSARFWTHN